MRFIATAIFLLTCASASRAERPNILFIAVDDLNHWVGYSGDNPQARTPNIDRLAARGMRFTRAYCTAPTCNPCRTALMTGYRPSTSGIYFNEDDWRDRIADAFTLPTFLHAHGYWTAGAGKIYHDSFRRPREWDNYRPAGSGNAKLKGAEEAGDIKYGALKKGDATLEDYQTTDWIIAQLAMPHDRPFFLACGLHKPHPPWEVPQKYFDQFPLDKIELPKVLATDLDDIPPPGIKLADPNGDHAEIVKSGQWKEAVQAYLATMAYADMNVGRLLDALDRSPAKEKTIIVLWGDHGFHLGEKQHWGKHALWEEATRTALIFVAPGVTKPNTVCDHAVDLNCIYPTLAELVHADIPHHIEGASVAPLLTDPAAPWTHPAIMTWGFQNHAVRSDDWRYIHYADGSEELYDEKADPLEWKNVANDPQFAAAKAELAKSLPTINTPEMQGPPTIEGVMKKRKK